MNPEKPQPVPPLHIISLGAGVQSSTMALMAAAGEIKPMPTCAIFADTQAEPASVMKWLDWLEKQLPFPVHRVTKGSLTAESLRVRQRVKTVGRPWSKSLIPAFVRHKDGTRGIMGRACTADFKLGVLLKKQKEIALIKRGQKTVGVISWIGISLDEVYRMKPSRDKWAANHYPLIERRMSRHDCLRWMERNRFPVPPRSACVYCPFHSDSEWRRLRDDEPQEFRKAVQFEKDLQAVKLISDKMSGVPFLHNSLRPLGEIEFTTDAERGQGDFFNAECEGMCGV